MQDAALCRVHLSGRSCCSGMAAGCSASLRTFFGHVFSKYQPERNHTSRLYERCSVHWCSIRTLLLARCGMAALFAEPFKQELLLLLPSHCMAPKGSPHILPFFLSVPALFTSSSNSHLLKSTRAVCDLRGLWGPFPRAVWHPGGVPVPGVRSAAVGLGGFGSILSLLISLLRMCKVTASAAVMHAFLPVNSGHLELIHEQECTSRWRSFGCLVAVRCNEMKCEEGW